MIQESIAKHKNSLTSFGLFILVLFLIWLFVKLILRIYKNWTNISTPGNITNIKKQQLISLTDRWTGITQGKMGLDSQFASIPKEQQLLINAHVFSTRLTGYSGTFNSGVFDEDNATRIALSSGSRCLILEIDYENNRYDPKLIYRDGWGMKQSLNIGSINKVAKSIAGRAFDAKNDGVSASIANDPLFVVLYFVRTPDQGKNPKEYLRFLGAVAEQLEPLRNHLIGQTAQGDFRRQGLESQLFFMNYNIFKSKIILLTNADTTGFRNLQSLGLAGDLGNKQDLDFMTHVRIYGRESPSQFGITGSPTSSIKPAAVITSSRYWMTIPSDRAKEAVESTKQAWTLVMEPVSSNTNQPDIKIITTVFNTYGINSLPTTIFSDPKSTELLTGKDMIFSKAAWSVKPELLRYIPPKPIPIQKPYPQANSGGGTVVAPKI